MNPEEYRARSRDRGQQQRQRSRTPGHTTTEMDFESAATDTTHKQPTFSGLGRSRSPADIGRGGSLRAVYSYDDDKIQGPRSPNDEAWKNDEEPPRWPYCPVIIPEQWKLWWHDGCSDPMDPDLRYEQITKTFGKGKASDYPVPYELLPEYLSRQHKRTSPPADDKLEEIWIEFNRLYPPWRTPMSIEDQKGIAVGDTAGERWAQDETVRLHALRNSGLSNLRASRHLPGRTREQCRAKWQNDGRDWEAIARSKVRFLPFA